MTVTLDFTPQRGDRVTVFGYDGDFVIQEVNTGLDGHYRFRLASPAFGLELNDIRYAMLEYSDEARVSKVLPQILAESAPWPEDLQVVPGSGLLRYQVKSDEMHDGTPTVIVSFFARPDVSPSFENAKVRVAFYDRLRSRFRFIGLTSWLQFTTKEERSVLSAAS